MSLPTIEELARVGYEADPITYEPEDNYGRILRMRQVPWEHVDEYLNEERINIGGIHTLDHARYAAFAATVRDAIMDALIAEADAGDMSLVRRVAIPGTYLVEEGDDVADWLRAMAREAVPEHVARIDAAGEG